MQLNMQVPSGLGENRMYEDGLFPTGGKAREQTNAYVPLHDPVKFRGRRYSPDERRYACVSFLVAACQPGSALQAIEDFTFHGIITPKANWFSG
jgi:hypothetical protein